MLESHHLTAASFRQSLFLVRVTDRGSNCRLNILNCRILNYFFQKLGMFQRQMALTTAHVDD